MNVASMCSAYSVFHITPNICSCAVHDMFNLLLTGVVKVTAQKCLRVSKMPCIFTLHCKGAGYVVPSKELKIYLVLFSVINVRFPTE